MRNKLKPNSVSDDFFPFQETEWTQNRNENGSKPSNFEICF